MTKDELLKLPPGTLVDVTTRAGVRWGIFEFVRVGFQDEAVCRREGRGYEFNPDELTLHTPQPQVSGTIETPPKLYTLHTTSWNTRNTTPATDAEIMAQECVRESRNTINVLNDEIAKRNEQIHNLRMRVEQLEAPPTTDEVKHAYNALLASGNRDEARVLQTLSHVVERLSDELTAKSGGRN